MYQLSFNKTTTDQTSGVWGGVKVCRPTYIWRPVRGPRKSCSSRSAAAAKDETFRTLWGPSDDCKSCLGLRPYDLQVYSIYVQTSFTTVSCDRLIGRITFFARPSVRLSVSSSVFSSFFSSIKKMITRLLLDFTIWLLTQKQKKTFKNSKLIWAFRRAEVTTTKNFSSECQRSQSPYTSKKLWKHDAQNAHLQPRYTVDSVLQSQQPIAARRLQNFHAPISISNHVLYVLTVMTKNTDNITNGRELLCRQLFLFFQ